MYWEPKIYQKENNEVRYDSINFLVIFYNFDINCYL